MQKCARRNSNMHPNRAATFVWTGFFFFTLSQLLRCEHLLLDHLQKRTFVHHLRTLLPNTANLQLNLLQLNFFLAAGIQDCCHHVVSQLALADSTGMCLRTGPVEGTYGGFAKIRSLMLSQQDLLTKSVLGARQTVRGCSLALENTLQG